MLAAELVKFSRRKHVYIWLKTVVGHPGRTRIRKVSTGLDLGRREADGLCQSSQTKLTLEEERTGIYSQTCERDEGARIKAVVRDQ